MTLANATAVPMTEAKHRAAFFRQSGWLMVANIAGGLLMWGVHFLAKKIPDDEYGVFGTFLTLVMLLPTMPLQMVLTQQTAKALATHRERELAGVLRFFWTGILILWAIACAVVLVFQKQILAGWHMTSPVGLWITLPILLLTLWMPIFWGGLQGSQNFLWLGWSMMLNGIGRILISALMVLALGAAAAGMMTGVLMGLVAATVVAAWQTRKLWGGPSDPCDWRGLLRQVLPLMLGFFAFQMMFTADTLYVKAYFTAEQTGHYVSAGTLSRALMWLVLPLASVMFPRIVHSTAKSEKTNLMGLVLIGTAVLAICGATCMSLLGPVLVKIVYKASFVQEATQILPWYAFAMVPLALANVLLNNLMARGAYKVVPAACIVAIAYAFALTRFHATLVMMLQTMGVANLLLFAACAWYTWGPSAKPGLTAEAAPVA
jgi:O-antigen/teichoic acid export membrane protein